MGTKTKLNDKGYLVFPNLNKPDKLVHRWKAEDKYGIDAVRGKDVHHIDKDKQNNDSSNLLLLSKEDHYNLHQCENKKEILSNMIIALAVLYFVMGFLSAYVFTLLQSTGMTMMRLAVLFILVLAIELRYNFISKTIRRPNEKVFKK